MHQHDWPGNVRELLNRVRRAIAMCDGRLIAPCDLGLSAENQPLDLNLEVARIAAERKTILTALQYSGRSAGKSAQMVGVSRATFYRLLEKHGFALTAGAAPLSLDAAGERCRKLETGCASAPSPDQ
jgi:DNA-binding NtrC family response regulator